MSCKLFSDSHGVTCTGYEGSEKWKAMHKVCNSIECSICSEHCNEHIQAWRDRIAYEKGKEVYDMANLKKESNYWKQTGDSLH